MNQPLQEIIRTLKDRTVLQALTPVRIWISELDTKIRELNLANSTDKSIIALMAGLHLWNDNLNASHSFSQEIEDDATGGYWHGLMHRMEQDYWNSQYWFRRVGNHPVKDTVQAKVADFLNQQDQLNTLTPSRIVDSLKRYRDQRSWNCDD